jgi:hypothetical protein
MDENISAMNLRDWFAGQAMIAFVNNRDATDTLADIAVWSYGMADAMMKERKG